MNSFPRSVEFPLSLQLLGDVSRSFWRTKVMSNPTYDPMTFEHEVTPDRPESVPSRSNERQTLRVGGDLTIAETCMCTATISVTLPVEIASEGFKQVSTWRRFHVCTYRTEESQPKSDWPNRQRD